MAGQNDKRTASQRIDDLERAVMSLFQINNNMAKDLTTMKDILKLLGIRVTSALKVSVAGLPLTEENVDAQMKQEQLEELKSKVTNLVNQGLLVPAQLIGEGTFIVGTENEKDKEDGTPGAVVHPRIQCTLASLAPEVQKQLTGAKVGDTVTFENADLVFKVQEVYQIVNPTPPGAPAEEPQAPAADATQQSSSDAAQAAAPAADPNSQAAGN